MLRLGSSAFIQNDAQCYCRTTYTRLDGTCNPTLHARLLINCFCISIVGESLLIFAFLAVLCNSTLMSSQMMLFHTEKLQKHHLPFRREKKKDSKHDVEYFRTSRIFRFV